MRWLAVVVLLAVGLAAGAAVTNGPPPVLFAGRPDYIRATPTGYLLTFPDGRTEEWSRFGKDYVCGAKRFVATPGGYEGADGTRFTRAAGGWDVRGSTGNTYRIVSSAGGFIVGDTVYTSFGSDFYTSPGGIRPSDMYKVQPEQIRRMDGSLPSSFRRWPAKGTGSARP